MSNTKDGFALLRDKIHLVAEGLSQSALKKMKGNFLHAKMALGEASMLLETERKKEEKERKENELNKSYGDAEARDRRGKEERGGNGVSGEEDV